MNGPYGWTVSLGATVVDSGAHAVKRQARRAMRRAVKEKGVLPDEGGEVRAKGDLRDSDGELVSQVEAYVTAGGAVKVRDLET